jgi:hypothetical protein
MIRLLLKPATFVLNAWVDAALGKAEVHHFPSTTGGCACGCPFSHGRR